MNKKTFQAYGRKAKGIPKNYSAEERAARAARFGRAAALARWAKRKPKNPTP